MTHINSISGDKLKYIETEAIVLHRKQYRNSSLIVSFMTKDIGKISLIIKGANREKSGMIGFFDLLNIIHLRLKESSESTYTFISANFSNHLLCESSYEKSQFQIASTELIRQWTIQDFESSDYFSLTKNYIESVKTLNYPSAVLFLRYIIRILKLTGVPINLFVKEPFLDRGDTYLFDIKNNTLMKCSISKSKDADKIVLAEPALRLINKINNFKYDNSTFPTEKKVYFLLYNLLKNFIIYHENSNFKLKTVLNIFSS